MAQCWKCGGQLPPYAVRCSWCGRSTTVSAFVQVLSIAAVVLAALIFAGVLPWSTVRTFVPGLRTTATAGPAETIEPGAAPRGNTPTGGYGKTEGVRSAEEARQDARRRSGEPAPGGTTSPGAVPADSTCASPVRLRTLAAAHPDWSPDDLTLIACRQIRVGFTAAQVRSALGRPTRIIRPGGQSTAEVWVYRDRRVVLERGVVVTVRE